jgi:hypothetical protein
VEVVLRFTAPESEFPSELRQFTGCTSERTLVTFVVPSLVPTVVPNSQVRRGGSRVQAEVSVLDDTGAILTHALAPIPVR